MFCRFIAIALLVLVAPRPTFGQISRIWLSHRTPEPDKLMVNWETASPGDSVVHYQPDGGRWKSIEIDEDVALHHVEIPLKCGGTAYRYRVATGDETSDEAVFRGYPKDELRVAVVADWQSKPDLNALMRDKPHLLLTAGDNISCVWQSCGPANKECVRPYAELIDRYPALFRSTPFLPALGNHDKEIRPRGSSPPPEPVYDVDATAFRRFFELPGDEWKWRFDIPAFGIRFVALDLNHTSDFGTTWQACHAFDKDSEQFRWYRDLMSGPLPPFVVTLYNEQNASIRGKAGGGWHEMFRKGTIAVTGFGYYAERAEVDGFTYYNTSLGTGTRYPDPQSKFIADGGNYVLLTCGAASPKLTVEIKALNGDVLDRKEYTASDGPSEQ